MKEPLHLSAPAPTRPVALVDPGQAPVVLRSSHQRRRAIRRLADAIALNVLVRVVGETKPGVCNVQQHGPLCGRARSLREPLAFLGPFSVVGGAAHGVLRFFPRMTEAYEPPRSTSIVQSI